MFPSQLSGASWRQSFDELRQIRFRSILSQLVAKRAGAGQIWRRLSSR